MPILSRPLRNRRPHEWTGGKAVTFIVTLAATRCVTLAAREAGMSRKSAYALNARDPAFADAWKLALNTGGIRRQSGKVEEVEGPQVSLGQGNRSVRAASSTESTSRQRPDRRREEAARDRFFARLAARNRRGSVALPHDGGGLGGGAFRAALDADRHPTPAPPHRGEGKSKNALPIKGRGPEEAALHPTTPVPATADLLPASKPLSL